MLQTPLGLSALVYGLAALAVGTVSTGSIKSTRWIPVVATMAASAAAVTLYAAARPRSSAWSGPSACASCR